MRGSRFFRTALVALVAVVGLSACRVDTRVATVVNADGSGSVTVTVDADAEVVAAEPNLAKEFKVTDLVQAGWAVDGPTPTAGGGLNVVLTRPFKNLAEANEVLASLSGPNGPLLEAMVSARGAKGEVHWSFVGSLDFSHGLEAAADQDLIAAVGSTPWLDQVTSRQLTPTDVASLTFSLTLPGQPETAASSSGRTSVASEPVKEWTVRPGDAALDLDVQTVEISKAVIRARHVESQFTALLIVYLFLVVGAGALWFYSRSRRNRPVPAGEVDDEVHGPRSGGSRDRLRDGASQGPRRSRLDGSRPTGRGRGSSPDATAPRQPKRSRSGELPPPRQRQPRDPR